MANSSRIVTKREIQKFFNDMSEQQRKTHIAGGYAATSYFIIKRSKYEYKGYEFGYEFIKHVESEEYEKVYCGILKTRNFKFYSKQMIILKHAVKICNYLYNSEYINLGVQKMKDPIKVYIVKAANPTAPELYPVFLTDGNFELYVMPLLIDAGHPLVNEIMNKVFGTTEIVEASPE